MSLTWIPTKRQEAFLSIPDSLFEALGGGAAGGGKTDVLLVLPIAKKTLLTNTPLYENHKFKMLYMRRTFPELEKEVIPRSLDFYKSSGAWYNDTKHRWTWPSGAIVQFGHCEHDKDVRKYDTAQYNIIAFDEVTSFTPYQYEYLTFQRCRSGSTDLPAFVRSATNPGNISHSYFKKRFVDPCKKGDTILREVRKINGKESTVLRIFIPFKALDNPYLMQSDPGYVDRLNRITDPAERLAKAEGDWDTFSGQVFEDFREFPLPEEPEWARHVINPFRIPEYWPKILSIDWGYSALTVAGWYAINPCPDLNHRAKIVKYREYSIRKAKISTWASDIARLNDNEELTDIVLDPSAWGHRGDELTIAEQFTQFSKMIPRKADNERLSGKLLMQEYIRCKPRPPRALQSGTYDHELALTILRRRGPKALDEYAALFQAEPEEILPKFQVFNTCTGTIENIPLCVYDTNKDKERPEDVAELKNDTDDFYDETRYGIKACQHYLDTGKSEHQKIIETQEVCSRLERSGGSPSAITKFYIDMANLEAKESKGIKARRFSGSRLKGANF